MPGTHGSADERRAGREAAGSVRLIGWLATYTTRSDMSTQFLFFNDYSNFTPNTSTPNPSEANPETQRGSPRGD